MEPFQVRWGGAALLFGLLAPLLTMLAQSSRMHPRFSLLAMRAGSKRKLRIVGNGAVQRTEDNTLSGLTQAGLVQDAVAFPQRQRGQSSFALLTPNNLKNGIKVADGSKQNRAEPGGSQNHS